jgi:predicted nuclease of restriction endonuclease-like RecB superfamily
MLTNEQSIVEFKAGQAFADRLTQSTHRHYLDFAGQMLSVYAHGIGQQRRQLHQQVEMLFRDEPDCPIRRIDAFCKLLDDKSVYQTDPAGNAAKLRLQVFSEAAESHPLVRQEDRLFEHTEQDVKEQIAQKLDISWCEIEQSLYFGEFQRTDKPR